MDIENLFAYGTLNDPKKQDELFGRRIEGTEDALDGYALSFVEQEGVRYAAAVPTASGIVIGKVLPVSAADLNAADAWEGEAYRREKVRLRSGVTAWVYLKK